MRFKGPNFSWKDDVNTNPVPDLSPEDEEVKKVKTAVLITDQVMPNRTEAKYFPEFLEWERFNHSSSLGLLKYTEKNRANKLPFSRLASSPPTVEEMR